MTCRRLLFWLHLVIGLTVGIVVAFLAITGSILAFQPQITSWAEAGARIANPAPPGNCIEPSALLATSAQFAHGNPSSLTLFADPHRPAEVGFGRDTLLLLNPCDGNILTSEAGKLRGFFLDVKDLHRWVAMGGKRHEDLRRLKDACNLAFLFLIISGFILWFPRKFRWQNLKPTVLFRRGLRGRARDWNLHNVFGFWMAVPLICIVLTGVIMSYAWANTLLYRAAGTPPPPIKAEAEQKQSKPFDIQKYTLLDLAIQKAKAQDPRWNSLSMRMPASKDSAIAFTLEEGKGGNPKERIQFSVSRKTGEVTRWEPFSSIPRGRQWRLAARYIHTGEIFGFVGQLVALLATLSALILVWTGFSLTVRRWSAWQQRRVLKKKQNLNPQQSFT